MRDTIKDKKRIVIKIGSSSLTYPETGYVNLGKLEKLVRKLTNLKNSGKEVVLVSSGAIAVGKKELHISGSIAELSRKQACAAVGQAQLMMIYQKLFSEYNQIAAQVLMTKNIIVDDISRVNVENTFRELLTMGVIPVVNENDTVSTYEMRFGDNDRLSAIVASVVHADLLILLSDIDGLFTDDPHKNPNAKFIPEVAELTDEFFHMGKSSSTSDVGTGGMSAKLAAAKIATESGADMIIANGDDLDVIDRIVAGEEVGTLFRANKNSSFLLESYIKEM
ncbi:MAG: glutamate 5-kinase [Lachnospiraceae bacterium]|nr:glutamate 5-kinase [Lachnospiraceae bacterium]